MAPATKAMDSGVCVMIGQSKSFYRSEYTKNVLARLRKEAFDDVGLFLKQTQRSFHASQKGLAGAHDNAISAIRTMFWSVAGQDRRKSRTSIRRPCWTIQAPVCVTLHRMFGTFEEHAEGDDMETLKGSTNAQLRYLQILRWEQVAKRGGMRIFNDSPNMWPPKTPELDHPEDYARRIPDIRLIALARAYTARAGKSDIGLPHDWTVINKSSGSYNTTYTIQYKNASELHKLIVRVPRNGFRLLPEDEFAWKSTKDTVDMISKLGVPVPRILDYDLTMDNVLKWPFQLMEHVSGTSLGQAFDDWDNHLSQADAWRRKMDCFTNLAQALKPLQNFRFPKAASLIYDQNGEIQMRDAVEILEEGWNRNQHVGGKRWASKTPMYSNVIEHTEMQLKKGWQQLRLSASRAERGAWRILLAMCEAMYVCCEFEDDDENRFVIAPPDFDTQNVYVHPETATVTGIIDWDNVHTVPKHIGFVAPLRRHSEFLNQHRDWDGQTLEEDQYPGQPMYRRMWQVAVANALDSRGDARFTARAHVYRAMVSVMEYPQTCLQFMMRMSAMLANTLVGQTSSEEHWYEFSRDLEEVTFRTETSQRFPRGCFLFWRQLFDWRSVSNPGWLSYWPIKYIDEKSCQHTTPQAQQTQLDADQHSTTSTANHQSLP